MRYYHESVDPNEIIYLSNCIGQNNILESQMDYYSDFSNSKALQVPDAFVPIAVGADQQWEQGSTTGVFIGSGLSFTVSGLDFSAGIGKSTGSGQRSDGAQFTCFREEELVLYSQSGLTCTKLYSCAHNNHIAFTETKSGPNSGRVTVVNAIQAADAFHNAYTAYDSASSMCSNTQFQIGSGCTISFTCIALNQDVFNAMASLLETAVAPLVTSDTTVMPGSCANQPVCENPETAPFTQCCAPVRQRSTFPTGGAINSFNVDQANPNQPSEQGNLGLTVTCLAPPDCNNSAWGLIGGAISAVDAPEFAILGFLTTLACGPCT